MSFTYSFSGNTTAVAQIRMLVQDNVEETAFLQDEEIAVILQTEPGNVYRAAAQACRTIAARLARAAGFKNTTVIYDPTEKAKEYRALAADFDTRAQQVIGTDIILPDPVPAFFDNGQPTGGAAFTRDLHFSRGYRE